MRMGDSHTMPQIKVMQQLTQWVMIHPERIRDKMEEQKDAEQTSWVSATRRNLTMLTNIRVANRTIRLGCRRSNVLCARR